MTFLEKDLEQIIFETDNVLLNERGLLIQGKKYRQPIIGGYGIADIVTFHKWGYNTYIGINEVTINVFEIKKEEINLGTFAQAIGYVKGIQRYLEKRKFDEPVINYHITLIGKKVNKSEFIYLPDVFENVSLYEYEYDYDGIRFNEIVDYCLINEGF